MGRITQVLSAIGELVKATVGGDDINEMEHLQGLGDDSKPLKDDYGMAFRTSQSGRYSHFGCYDHDNKITQPGERRIYGRNSDGEVVNSVYLKGDGEIQTGNDNCSVTQKADGTVITTNGAGSISLLADGTIDLNGLTITPGGKLFVGGEAYELHGHLPGTYTDSLSAPVTGNSGGKV